MRWCTKFPDYDFMTHKGLLPRFHDFSISLDWWSSQNHRVEESYIGRNKRLRMIGTWEISKLPLENNHWCKLIVSVKYKAYRSMDILKMRLVAKDKPNHIILIIKKLSL